jgi:pimeloyl-ACP methyl ester carboxylesterase
MLATGIMSMLPGINILEPLQRGSADSDNQPLTVARHVADLHTLIQTQCPDEKPKLVGHSWGAMLILAYAAVHPDVAGSLTLIGCGTFDTASRARFVELSKQHDYHFDVIPSSDPVAFDEQANKQTWLDMLRCQAEGLYPASFSIYHGDVTMIHGDYDPHPGSMIRDSLRPHLPQLRYHELQNCGHEPWRERQARDAFFEILRERLRGERKGVREERNELKP